jgi:hypothetical protein
MHHFSIRVVSLLSFIYSLLRSKKQEESSPNLRTISTRETKKILRWRTTSTSIEFRRNNDRVTASTIQTVHADTRNRTEIGVDRALTLTGTLNPGAGVEVRTISLRQRSIAGTNGIPRLITEQETTLSHVRHRSFLEPRFLKANIYVTKYHQKILFTLLHRNLTNK